VQRVDYDAQQFRAYARGRALTEQQMQAWISAFAARLPEARPLVGLDVGSGTGRYAPALAEAFGPVTGVEPSVQMREVAEAESRHPGVRYVAGAAEDLPVPSGSADYAVMMQSWHHVQDKPRAARELARALKPGARLILHVGFSDHMPRIWWLEQFPRGPEVDAAMFQPLHVTIETFTAAGWRVADFGTVVEPSPGTRAELLERLRLRTHSMFTFFTPDEIEAGFRNLEAAVDADPGAAAPGLRAPVLTLERSSGS
jgi:ubiquinone/menaquinone biosynthesis C-methylase UbiE